ncbi:MAG: type I methionyl aminopeptidase [Candidatus Marinimicrobia bacterium]|nr:type I methionyl aminopeptidase [Candidatus Neomarinimicrobiota bacterium]
MIYIRNSREIGKIKASCEIVRDTLYMLEELVEPGVTTFELDKKAEEFIKSNGAKPGFKGLYGFPATLCVSINDEVVHGIPKNRKLEDGDIIGIDCGTYMNGFYGDHAKSFTVGKVDSKVIELLKVTKESLYLGIEQAIPGNNIGDIGFAIQNHVDKYNYGIVKDLVGHGIGEKLHEEPQIPNYGKKGRGAKIKAGMCFAIEPMINLGTDQVYTKSDSWTVCTKDGKPSAHFEHTITVTNDKPIILTK